VSIPDLPRRVALRRARTFDDLDPFEQAFGDVVAVPDEGKGR
jgi:hypothetical protein